MSITSLHPCTSLQVATQRHREFRDNTEQRLTKLEELVSVLIENQENTTRMVVEGQDECKEELDEYRKLQKNELACLHEMISVLNERQSEVSEALASVEPVQPPKPPKPRAADSTSRRSPSPGKVLCNVKAQLVEKRL